MAPAQGNRSAILAGIQKALSVPVPPPPAYPAEGARLLPLPPGEAALRERFRVEFETLRGRLIAVADAAAAGAALAELGRERGWRRWAVAGGTAAASILGQAAARARLPAGAQIGEVDPGRARQQDFSGWLSQCDVGVTGCDAWIAHTGSILISPRTGGGRALSVLPPIHVAVGTWQQLAADLDQAFERLRAGLAARAEPWPTWVSVISGPSRTADIEKILVFGAHGPRELFAIIHEAEGEMGDEPIS